jgi:hypothetical protein
MIVLFYHLSMLMLTAKKDRIDKDEIKLGMRTRARSRMVHTCKVANRTHNKHTLCTPLKCAVEPNPHP